MYEHRVFLRHLDPFLEVNDQEFCVSTRNNFDQPYKMVNEKVGFEWFEQINHVLVHCAKITTGCSESAEFWKNCCTCMRSALVIILPSSIQTFGKQSIT